MSSTIKIKAPAMPDVVNAWSIQTTGDNLERLLQDRDAQWQEMVGPVVKALADALESVEDYMHGMEFGTCDRDAITNGRAVLSAITEE